MGGVISLERGLRSRGQQQRGVWQPRSAVLLAWALISMPWHWTLAAEWLSVTGDNVPLYANASGKGGVQWELGDGYPLKVIERRKDWIHVKDFENDAGWVSARGTRDKPRHVIVSANRDHRDRINIRQGAGTQHGIVARAAYGVVLEVLEVQKDWVKVRHAQGVSGWVSRNLVWGL